MTSQRWMLAVWFALSSVLGTGESVATTQTQKYTCRTFGSGVVQPFNGSTFYVRSNCLFTLTHFTHNRVECDITTRRGDSGLLVQVEIIINKVRTILQNGSIQVERKSVSLPYDHTYQHIFHYGIYTKLRSSLLPLSVTWHNVPGGIDTLWVELEQELSTDMTGLCGRHNGTGNQKVVMESVLADDTCQTRDPIAVRSPRCDKFFSRTFECLLARQNQYRNLCEKNNYKYEMSKGVTCSFFKEVAQQCGNTSRVWGFWRDETNCDEPECPGDLIYEEQGPAFVPSCSNPNPRFSNQDYISTCVCPAGKVLNDQADGFHCVSVSSCPCVFAGKSYSTGDTRSTKCQSCICDSGKWRCSENICPARCIIEGQHVTTFDGKEYVLPGKCTYVASKGFNWTITIELSKKAPSLKTVVFQLFQEKYTVSQGVLKIGEKEITELHISDNVLVFWQSSMYVHFRTSFGMKIEVQMSPEIQLYITPPANHTGMISGLCGNSNNDTTDDFTTPSGIIENSAQPFALSWSMDDCGVVMDPCINKDNEIFADDKCSVLNNPDGIFAECHSHIPTDHYHRACILRTCTCGSSLQQCLCVALSNYVKACASLGVVVGDWRKATNCTVTCQKNQEFSYDNQVCNHTCLSLFGPDPRCGMDDAPVEGCGCPEGTHLNQGNICTRKADCFCHYHGGIVPPGSVIVDGQKCYCGNGKLQCFPDCAECLNGKVCVNCASFPVNTAQKTCDSLSKPMSDKSICNSGCYCPEGQYEDHRGNCVTWDNCTCVYSGKVFSPGQHVKTKTKCKTCTCGQGQWHCKDEPCPGKCQVYGNGHYQTFDSKWYRFDGHCQYTLVEDGCDNKNGTFSVRVESVPCCDEALTCSRSIILDLQGKVTLTLSDMNVTRQNHEGWTLQDDRLFSMHTVGLYIIISVPSRGITLIWDKHTRITIELHEDWRKQVCGLCGNFDSNEMNDLKISGSAVASSSMAFGNSWKVATPPCSDVTTEIFPCERNSYCSAWAQRRCMIIRGDTFKACHFKVDPEPYYHACVQESCSCEFEGKFLGFCTAVSAYAEACSDQDVCVNWRTPDLCPVYCDYYNEKGQCSWHYEACGKMLTCSEGNYLPHKLEGCYPRCPMEAPYYDENTGECTELRNCTCYFNDTIIQPWAVLMIDSTKCHCENGTTKCSPPPPPPTTMPATTTTTTETTVPSTTSSSTTSTATETTVPTTTSPPTTTTTSPTTTETTEPTTTSPPTTTTTSPTTTETTEPTTSSPPTTTTTSPTTTETTEPTTSSPPTTTTSPTTTETTEPTTTSSPTTTFSTTTETTVPSTTYSYMTTTSSITNETTVPSTTSSSTTSTTTETTVPSTTYSYMTTTSSITNETTVPSTTSSSTTSTTTETTVPSTTYSYMTTTSSITNETTVPSTTSSSTTSTTTETTVPTTTSPPTTTTTSPTTTETTEPTTSSSPTTTFSNTTEITVPSTTSSSATSTTTETTVPSTTYSYMTTTSSITTETTVPSTTYTIVTGAPLTSPGQTTNNITKCECEDLKRNKTWSCNEMWTEDCFNKICKNGMIELTPVVCPEPKIPTCPRNLATSVSDGCCETYKCDCRCELYGDPHYISFEGVTFDFLEDCTYILVEEQSPQHHLTIIVDNFYCVPGISDSCVKGIMLKYQNNTARLSVMPHLFAVQATLNDEVIKPPYEENGLRFETTGYQVFIYLPEIRSYVSLTPSFTLVVNLAMEHFLNNTQGQCGVCGGGSCIRKGGQIEDDSCCDKTAYDWLYDDPSKKACATAPRDVPCHSGTTPIPTRTPSSTTSCPASSLCELLDHPVFSSCSRSVDLFVKKKNCEFDSCRNGACSSLEQAAEECKKAGFCIDWRRLTNGSCDVPCPAGLIYRQCQKKLDDVCYGGVRYRGSSIKSNIEGCFCPSGLLRAGNHSNVCVPDCLYCKGPLGEPRLPGEVWQSNCHQCTCNNRTLTVECIPKPSFVPPACSPDAVLVNTSCCGDQTCVEKTCTHNGKTYMVGDRWKDATHPCTSFNCTKEGIQTETRVCPAENCHEADRIWDSDGCCYKCNQSCAPKVNSIYLTLENCTTIMQIPVCEGQCVSKPSVVLRNDLQVEQNCRCCQERSSEKRQVTLQCYGRTARQYTYKHITSCECKACEILK